MSTEATPRSRALQVALGIFSSRIVGLIREQVVAFSFGVSAHADVFATAFRAPNALQTLLGEQTLSAAFIPTYVRLLKEGRERDAGRFAGAVFGLLLAASALLALAGVLCARPLVAVFAAGYLGDAARVAAGELSVDRFELAVSAVRLIFPMTALLVLSAWALGVLNSHRRFFLPYFAPVLWNAAIIAALLLAGTGWGPDAGGGSPRDRLLFAGCLGALAGGLLQFLVQLPLVLRLLAGFRISLSTRVAGVREALAAFGPALAGRGVVQLSLYLDHFLASLLAAGAPGAIRWASVLYALPISLFAMSVAAAELPELAQAGREQLDEVGRRTARGLRQIAFLVAPTTLGYLGFGFLVVAAVYRRGEFQLGDNWLVYLVLAAYTLGLPASTSSRLVQNLFYALGDTRTPARVAALRVSVAAVVGGLLMWWLDTLPLTAAVGPLPGSQPLFLGAAGLAVGSAVGSWLELLLLRRRLARELPALDLGLRSTLRFYALALPPALPAALLWWASPALPVWLLGVLVVALYGAGYLALATLTGVDEARSWLGRLRRHR